VNPTGPNPPGTPTGWVTLADLAPIVAFQLDFVGPINGWTTKLSSGAGTITYSASNSLIAFSQMPICATGLPTGEAANSLYDVMSVIPGAPLVQTFRAIT
jgi:hypothetical protein